jgi:hypothetical protein
MLLSIEGLWDLVRTIVPWLTGGLAGAMLTYFLNRRIAHRKQARLSLTTGRVNYSIDATDEHLKELRVSYRGNEFDSLMLYQIELQNISSRTILRTPVLLCFAKETVVVDQSSLTRPLNRSTKLDKQAGHECAYLWDAGELKPQDSARLRLLLSPTTLVGVTWRGDDEIAIAGGDNINPKMSEVDVLPVIAWMALFVAVGSLPILSGLLQAILLIASAPYIALYINRWRPLFSSRKDQSIEIIASGNSKVDVFLAPGNAAIPTSIQQGEASAPSYAHGDKNSNAA